jgi:hypothetical protein
MTDVFDKFDKHFGGVRVVSVMKGGDVVGRIMARYPRDGAGRLYVYAQLYGAPMVRGSATGFGYDKLSAAASAAGNAALRTPEYARQAEHNKFATALSQADGSGLGLDRVMEGAGFRCHWLR